ncbi:metal ABC transporter ATP-binding protein [Psychrobacter sp.]|uniref:metal ABC transporter ATP-binding protein n=1 Tax=Psychrobacter sp. TaxID=56811 RepID=UPI00344DC5DD
MTLQRIGFEVSSRGIGESKFSSKTSNDSQILIKLPSKPSSAKRTGWLSGARSAKAASHTQSAAHESKTLLTDISLQILPNEKISVIGPNGAGKSTLMKLILGLIEPSSGKISRHPNLKLGYVPQKFTVPAILPLRVEDLLAQTTKRVTATEQAYLYERLSVTQLLKKQVIHLSGGETQRILLARSLLSKPNLLVLDEPMQGLDPESERWLYEFIDDLPAFLRCAMVVVSHDLHWVMRGSRRVICLNKHICCEGQPSDLGVSEEFKKLFGHQYEQPYIHKPHDCLHHGSQLS